MIWKPFGFSLLALVAFSTFGIAAEEAATTVDAKKVTSPETVTVRNAGNDKDASGYGAVGYEYKIGKYEVTNAQYCEFLNAVGVKDLHDLYDRRMAGEYGGISRKGSYGQYVYTLAPFAAKMPVGYVTWESAARYANWLSNGKGDGSTEKGVYTFKFGSVTVADHTTVAAGDKVQWAIPTEDEWYKAAYYDPAKSGGAGYWKYPGKSNFSTDATINTSKPTNVGSHTKTGSAYGTFDQGGNMWEYNELRRNNKVGVRGGSFFHQDTDGYQTSGIRYEDWSAKWPNYGFRVVSLGKTK